MTEHKQAQNIVTVQNETTKFQIYPNSTMNKDKRVFSQNQSMNMLNIINNESQIQSLLELKLDEFPMNNLSQEYNDDIMQQDTLAFFNMNPQQKATHFLQKYDQKNTELVSQTYLKINDVLENLNSIHDQVIKYHEKDFIASYKEHMLKVQCELIHLKKKSNDFYLKMQKDERIKFLESALQWFRNEAMCLANYIQDIRTNNKELKKQIYTVNNEREFYKNYTIATKRQNNVLKSTIDQLKNSKQQNSLQLSEFSPQNNSNKTVIQSPIINEPLISHKGLRNKTTLRTIANNRNNYSLALDQVVRISTAQDSLVVPYSNGKRLFSPLSLSITTNQQSGLLRNKNLISEQRQSDMLNIVNKNIISGSMESNEIKNNLNQTYNQEKLEILCENLKQELDDKDKQIQELQRQLKEFKKKFQNNQHSSQNNEVQSIFLDCVQAIKQNNYLSQGIDHLSTNEKSQIITKFVTNKKILGIVYDIMFERQKYKNFSLNGSLFQSLDSRVQSQRGQNFPVSQERDQKFGLSTSVFQNQLLAQEKPNIMLNSNILSPNNQTTISKQFVFTKCKDQTSLRNQKSSMTRPMSSDATSRRIHSKRQQRLTVAVKNGKLQIA